MDANEAQTKFGENLTIDNANWEQWSNGLSKRPFKRCKHGNVVLRQIIGFDKNLEEWWDEAVLCVRCEDERKIATKIALEKTEEETAKWEAYDKQEEPQW